MFEKYNLDKKIDDQTLAKKIEPLQEELGVLQRQLRDEKIPVIIMMEGWNASGITNTIQEIIHYLDPRGFSLYSIGNPSDDEKKRPLMWRFWVRTPSRGRIAIFARGWYSRALAETVSGIEWKENLKKSIISINRFERQLADDGTIIIKFFLHISPDEQKRRLLLREKNPLTSWLITQGDWDFHHHYDSFLPVIEDLIERTDKPYAPWTVVEADDPNHAILRCYSTLLTELKKQRDTIASRKKHPAPDVAAAPKKSKILRRSSARDTLSKPEYQEMIAREQARFRDLQYLLYKRGIPLFIVFEGWDAAGKGGAIMRLTRDLNPRGYSVMPVAGPNDLEKEHHYLWRFICNFPKNGHITLYDRSWYGRVLVERVEGFCPEAEWKRAYAEINEMEEELVLGGSGLVKCWFEVSKDEQIRRFHQREEDPLKQWKITPEDWRNREKWDEYSLAIDEMLARTSTKHAPWTIIESDDKWHARYMTLKTVTDYCERLLE